MMHSPLNLQSGDNLPEAKLKGEAQFHDSQDSSKSKNDSAETRLRPVDLNDLARIRLKLVAVNDSARARSKLLVPNDSARARWWLVVITLGSGGAARAFSVGAGGLWVFGSLALGGGGAYVLNSGERWERDRSYEWNGEFELYFNVGLYKQPVFFLGGIGISEQYVRCDPCGYAADSRYALSFSGQLGIKLSKKSDSILLMGYHCRRGFIMSFGFAWD